MTMRSSTTFHSLYSSYGPIGLAGLFKDYCLTKLAYPQARLMRRPLYLRGRKWMALGDGFTCGRGLRIEVFPHFDTRQPLLQIGTNVQINDYVHIAVAERVFIGDRVLVASKVHITDHNHGRYSGALRPDDDPLIPPAHRPLSCKPVVIEDDVWIGESAVILPGVTLGRGSVIGALSTVTKDVPAYSISVGSPARVIRQYDFDAHSWIRT